jgi:hypothetical protein
VEAGGGLGRDPVVEDLGEELVDQLGSSAGRRLGQAGDQDYAFAWA